MPERIPFYLLQPQHEAVRKEVLRAIESVYDRGSFVMGDALSEFEAGYSEFVGVKYCVGVASGLDALVLSLRALEIGPGDEVIVPAHTFIATWLAVSSVGATIIPVDPEILTYTIDCSKIQSVVTPRTRAIIPVHLYGQSCTMDELVSIAGRHNISIVEDCAQSQGARFAGKMTGSFGICNATSFYPVKNLGALGDGGAITTSSIDLARKVRQLRNYGSSEKYLYARTGINSRLDELQAAILSIKLRHIGGWNSERMKIAKNYHERLRGVGDLVLPQTGRDRDHIYHRFVVRTSKREKLMESLRNNGVETMIHYPVPPHLQRAYDSMGFKAGSFPIAEEISATCLSLPIWPGMNQQVEIVTDAIRRFYS